LEFPGSTEYPVGERVNNFAEHPLELKSWLKLSGVSWEILAEYIGSVAK
jgi:hypothetical protein